MMAMKKPNDQDDQNGPFDISDEAISHESPTQYPREAKRMAQRIQLINCRERNLMIFISRMPKARALAKRNPKIYWVMNRLVVS